MDSLRRVMTIMGAFIWWRLASDDDLALFKAADLRRRREEVRQRP